MKKFLVFLFIGISTYITAQNTVSGKISDSNQSPILGAQIYIEQIHLGTTSDENGNFKLENIPKGNHQITFSYLGFNTYNLIITIPNSKGDLNIILAESVFHMDEVLLSTPFHKIQSENVMKVEFKKIRSLEKNGGATLIQNIVSIPGIEQISTGTGIGKPVIRGLSGNRVLVYAQGVRLENQQFGDEHGLGLNESGVESVEIIKGPASLLYGSDALGGVLYFNPERFALINETNVNINQKFFSNTLGSNTSLGLKTSKTNFKYLIRGTYITHSDYKIPNGDRVTNTRFNEKDLKIGIGYNSDKYISEFRYNFNKAEIGITEGIEDQTSNKSPDLPYQNIDNHIFSLHNHIFIDASKLDINLGYVFNNRKEFEEEHVVELIVGEENDLEAALHMKLKTFTYDLKYNFPKNKAFETIIGIQGLIQNNKNFGKEILIPNADIIDIGVLVSSLYTISPDNSLQGGIRFDYRDLKTDEHLIIHEDETHVFEALTKTYKNINASLGYKTQLFKHITTRINLASGYRAPNLAELTSNGVHHGTNRFERGNPDLNSEKNFQFDLSLEYGNEHVEVFANTFLNKINDYIFIAPNGEIEDGFDVYTYLQDDAKLYGGEFGFHLHPHPLDWLHLESSFETVTGKLDNGNYLPLIPANKISNTIRSEFKGNRKINELFIALKLNSYFQQNKVSEFEEKSKGYNLLNFSLGGNVILTKTNLRLNFNINNVFNKSYVSHLSALKINGIANIGRNFIFGVNIEI